MRVRHHLVTTLLTVAVTAFGQPSKHSSSGQTVTDKRLHIAFDLPADLQAKPNDAVNLHGKQGSDEFLVAAAQHGSEPFGIVLIAQGLHSQPKITTASQFMNAVRLSRSSTDVLGASGHATNASGLVFDWLDWTVPGKEYASAVLTQRGGYFLAARCNAKTLAELQAMKTALMTMRTTD